MSLLSAEALSFLEQSNRANFALVGAASPALVPSCARALCIRVLDAGARVHVWLHEPGAQALKRDVEATGRVALVSSHFVTARSLQVKGRLDRVVRAGEDERAFVEEANRAFIQSCLESALPGEPLSRLETWPALRLEFTVLEAFEQTPGPGAGHPVARGVK